MGENRRKVGAEYEELAVSFLQQQGYIICERNYYTRHGELDIIAQHQGYLCFIEVKYRKNLRYGSAAEAVSVTKQRRMYYAARCYLTRQKRPLWEKIPIRFDVVAIQGETVQLLQNAFEIS